MSEALERATESARLTIIGAGIIGICAALEARKAGYEVTLIDRLPPGEAASFGIAGIISPWSVVPQAMPGLWKKVPRWFLDPYGPVKVRWRDLPHTLPWVWRFFKHANVSEAERISDAMAFLMRDNQDIFAEYLAGTGEEGLLRSSSLITVSRDAERPSMSALAQRLQKRHGADQEVLSGDEIREIEPHLSKDITYGVVLKNQSRSMDPGRTCQVLAELVRKRGVQFVRTSVDAIVPNEDGSFNLRTNNGDIHAEKLLLSAGAWSLKLLKPLGVNIPLIGERGYHLLFSDPQVQVNNSISDGDAKIILSQMNTGVRVAGTAEFADVDAPANYNRARALLPLAKRLLPDLQESPNQEWMGVRPSFPDNLPAIGQIGRFRNLFGAFGHSHYGFGMAPQTARLVTRLISGQTPNEDVSAVSFDRFLSR